MVILLGRVLVPLSINATDHDWQQNCRRYYVMTKTMHENWLVLDTPEVECTFVYWLFVMNITVIFPLTTSYKPYIFNNNTIKIKTINKNIIFSYYVDVFISKSIIILLNFIYLLHTGISMVTQTMDWHRRSRRIHFDWWYQQHRDQQAAWSVDSLV